MKKITLISSILFLSISLINLESTKANTTTVDGRCYVCDAISCAPAAGFQTGANDCIDIEIPGHEPNLCALYGGACGIQ